MIWLFFVVRVLLMIALIGAGVTVIRQAHARSGYLMAAAGGLQLLTSCCVRGLNAGVEHTYDNMLLFQGLTVLSSFGYAIGVILAIASLVGLANELNARKKAGAQPPAPPPVAF